MDKEIKFNDINKFIEKLKELEITKIAFSEINERRAVTTGKDKLDVLIVKNLILLAYSDSIIYKYEEKDAEHEEIFLQLQNHDFEIKRINKNIT